MKRSGRKISKRDLLNSVFDAMALLFLCAHSANLRPENLFDSIFCTASFCGLFGASVLLAISQRLFYPNRYELTLAVFIGYCAISTIWSSDSASFFGIFGSLMKNFVFVFGVSSRVRTKRDMDRFIGILFVSILYTAVLLVIRTPLSSYGSTRIGSVLGLNANGLGIRMYVGMVAALYFLLSNDVGNKRGQSVFLILIIILFITITLFTGSRKSAFACVFSLCMIVVFTARSEQRLLRRIALLIAIVFGTVYLVFSIDGLYNVLGKRIDRLFSFLHGDILADSSSALRSELAAQASSVFMDHPLIGCGANNFLSYNSYGFYSHNNYLELLSTLGLIGFGVYYSQYAKIFINIFRRRYALRDHQTLIVFVLLLTIMICETGLVTYYGVFYQSVIGLMYLFSLFEPERYEGGKRHG